MAPLITLSKVNKVYQQSRGPVQAIRDFTLEVAQGEVVAVVGPSGCGKTTLLRIVAGVLSPSAGSISIAGKSSQEYRENDGIGLVFQRPVLFPWRTVIRNVMLPSEVGPNRTRDSGAKQRAEHLLSLMGLEDFGGAYPRQLSGGMLQRTALARALLNRPKLLLLDEAFSALDELTREQLWLDFIEMWRLENPTVLLVTHSIREAVFLGDRVVVMSSLPGQVRAEQEISLPRSRSRATLTSPAFLELCEAIRRKLE